jgi:hypothetical protein
LGFKLRDGHVALGSIPICQAGLIEGSVRLAGHGTGQRCEDERGLGPLVL